MTATTLNRSSMPGAAPLSVGVALRELGVAGQRLAAALWASMAAVRLGHQRSEPSAAKAAQTLRVYASTLAVSDPRFARDLFAAADRHEYGDTA
jgi:hypothetical protein